MHFRPALRVHRSSDDVVMTGRSTHGYWLSFVMARKMQSPVRDVDVMRAKDFSKAAVTDVR
jgi:hypothetical protein